MLKNQRDNPKFRTALRISDHGGKKERAYREVFEEIGEWLRARNRRISSRISEQRTLAEEYKNRRIFRNMNWRIQIIDGKICQKLRSQNVNFNGKLSTPWKMFFVLNSFRSGIIKASVNKLEKVNQSPTQSTRLKCGKFKYFLLANTLMLFLLWLRLLLRRTCPPKEEYLISDKKTFYSSRFPN